jgi:hypothetical protein
LTEPEKPVWKTGVIWGILAVFLVVGTLGLATVVYGVLGLLTGAWVYAIAVGIGAPVAVLAFLFMVGILYRIDRYRGATYRKVRLFE